MKELSLNILDITENSKKAGATDISIEITEDEKNLSFSITDNGCGMTAEFLESVVNPFTTTRTTRKVGMGIPLLKMEALMAGGDFKISSKSEKEYADHGTVVYASFDKTNIDYIPLGDIIGTLCVLIQGLGSGINIQFTHTKGEATVELSTREMREMLGEDVPLGSPEVILWVKDYLTESYGQMK